MAAYELMIRPPVKKDGKKIPDGDPKKFWSTSKVSGTIPARPEA